jgi:hypothetical protein
MVRKEVSQFVSDDLLDARAMDCTPSLLKVIMFSSDLVSELCPFNKDFRGHLHAGTRDSLKASTMEPAAWKFDSSLTTSTSKSPLMTISMQMCKLSLKYVLVSYKRAGCSCLKRLAEMKLQSPYRNSPNLPS